MDGKVPESLDLAVDGASGAIAADFLPGAALPGIVRRFTGDGVINLLTAKAEVEHRIRSAGGVLPAARTLDDALRPDVIPSVASGRIEDRILAEIDQDGFAFAEDP